MSSFNQQEQLANNVFLEILFRNKASCLLLLSLLKDILNLLSTAFHHSMKLSILPYKEMKSPIHNYEK